MPLILILFLGVFFVGLIGGYFINLILKRFPAKFKLHLEELKERNTMYKRQLYQDISREGYSLLYVGQNTPRFLVIILFTSILEAVITVICKSYIASFFIMGLLAFSFCMVLRLPLLIEFFIRGTLYEARRSDILYRNYIFRVRPFVYGVAIIPLLIALII